MRKINHIGLIPDGTRRWASNDPKNYLSAYKYSMTNIGNFIQYSVATEITSISIYMLSVENLQRKQEDLQPVIAAEIGFLDEILPALCHRYNCKIIHAGNPVILPDDMARAMTKACEQTKYYLQHKIYILLGYSPIDEIASAIEYNNSCKIDLERLWVPEKVDLVIRTAGGPALLSNFLPLQCGYAQIYIIDKYFNDFTEEDFNSIYEKAAKIQMPYGK